MDERGGAEDLDRTDVPRPDARRHEFRLSLLVAAIAVVGTLIGSLCGGVFTLLNTSNQVEATVFQSENEFLRTQRQQIYSELLTAANEVRLTSGSVSMAFDRFDGPMLLATVQDIITPLHDQEVVFTSKFAAVELIGSAPVVEPARRMVVEYSAGTETVGWLTVDLAEDDTVPADTLSARQQQFVDHFQAGMNAQEEFLTAVRDELGIPDHGNQP
ncbi:hypothetical protein EEB14_00210 [Rhodococcus sp. WS4]|nr:hypothetical protein EEB14_00210 [Rhodococcus sp. WS4]